MQRILLAIDDTSASSEAVYATAEVARALEADVAVLHVYTEEQPPDRLSPKYIGSAALVNRAADLLARSEVTARSEVRWARSQEVADEILEAARGLPADLIVLGCRGRPPLAALVLGGVGHAVVADAPCPVLLVRSARNIAYRGVRKILLGIEGDAESEDLFTAVVGLARGLDAAVEVVHVSYPGEEDLEKDLHRARASHGEQALEEISERLHKAGVTVTTRGLTGQSGVARELEREADAEDAGLIVIGTGHLKALADRLAGGVAESLLHRTRRPVLLVTEPA